MHCLSSGTPGFSQFMEWLFCLILMFYAIVVFLNVLLLSLFVFPNYADYCCYIGIYLSDLSIMMLNHDFSIEFVFRFCLMTFSALRYTDLENVMRFVYVWNILYAKRKNIIINWDYIISKYVNGVNLDKWNLLLSYI